MDPAAITYCSIYRSILFTTNSSSTNEQPMRQRPTPHRYPEQEIHVIRQDMRRFLYNKSDTHINRLEYRKIVVSGRQAEMDRFAITDLPPNTCMRIEYVLPSYNALTVWDIRRIDWDGRAAFNGSVDMIESHGFGDINPNMVDSTITLIN